MAGKDDGVRAPERGKQGLAAKRHTGSVGMIGSER